MKRITPGLALIALCCAIGFFLLRRAGISSPKELLTPAATTFKQSFRVKPRYQQLYTISLAGAGLPGRLFGTWKSSGKSAGIQGANDDTLIGFEIRGPGDEVLQKSTDHEVHGNFSLRVKTAGTYTLVFDNSGLIRSSERLVEVDATYQPD